MATSIARYRRPPTDPDFDKFAKSWDRLSRQPPSTLRRSKHKAELRELWKVEPPPKDAECSMP